MTIGRVNLSKIVNEEFITTLQKMSSLSSTTSKSSSSSDSSSVTLSSTFQSGAGIYANSISALNSLVSYLNVSKGTLDSLLELTDSMISLAKKAKSSTIGTQTRNKLNVQYSKLIRSFEEILTKADKSDKNILTKDGLTSLFEIVGLKPDVSASIAELFDEFVFEGDDKILASKEIKTKTQTAIPYSSLIKEATSETSKYSEIKITNLNSLEGTSKENIGSAVSTNASVVNQLIDGNNTVSFISKNTGETNTIGNDGYQYKLKAVNETTGFSVISKYENDEMLSDLYLYDNTGTLIQRLTDDSKRYGEVAISDDSKSILYSSINNLNESSLEKITISNLGEAGVIENLETQVTDGSIKYDNLKISSDGNYFAYTNLETNINYLKNYDTLENDDNFSAKTSVTQFDFLNSNMLAIYDGENIKSYTYGGMENDIAKNVNIDNLVAIENKNGNHSYICYVDNTQGAIKVINDDNTQIIDYRYNSLEDSLSNISLTYNTSGVVELGILGKISSISKDSNEELYRVNGERTIKYSKASKIATTVFDATLNLKSPANAYRVIDALSTLKEQLETNLEVMKKATNVINLNIDLVRATGFALLDLSEQVTSADDAETLARKLKNKIRSDAPQALSQAENLEPLAIAAMMLNNDI